MSVSENRDLHQQILTAATQLFIEHGYHGLAMRQIAEAVGVSKAALYYYFKDKEELFLKLLDSHLGEIEELIDRVQREEATCHGQIQSLVGLILAQPVEKRAMIRLASQEMDQLSPPAREAVKSTYHTRFLKRVQELMQAGIQRGELRPLDPDVAAWALLGMLYPYFYPALAADVPPAAESAGQLVMIFLQGVSA